MAGPGHHHQWLDQWNQGNRAGKFGDNTQKSLLPGVCYNYFIRAQTKLYINVVCQWFLYIFVDGSVSYLTQLGMYVSRCRLFRGNVSAFWARLFLSDEQIARSMWCTDVHLHYLHVRRLKRLSISKHKEGHIISNILYRGATSNNDSKYCFLLIKIIGFFYIFFDFSPLT